MKTLHSFTAILEKWRRQYQDSQGVSNKRRVLPTLTLPENRSKKPKNLLHRIHQSHPMRKLHAPLMAGLAIISLTGVVGYRFYNQPQLAVDILSPITIRAPRDGSFKDDKTTQLKRKEAQTAIVPILKRDDDATRQLKRTLDQLLEEIEQLRQLSRAFPFADLKPLSPISQQYLRSCSESEWKAILGIMGLSPSLIIAPSSSSKAVKSPFNPQRFLPAQSPLPPFSTADPLFEKAKAELQSYRQSVLPSDFKAAITKIVLVRQQYTQVLAKGSDQHSFSLTPAVTLALIDLSESAWQDSQKAMRQALEKILIQGISPGIPPSMVREVITMQLESSLTASVQSTATEVLQTVLQSQPNLAVDKEATKLRAEKAAQSVTPMIVQIKRGEVIIKAGEKISQERFVLLDGFGLSRRETNWVGLGVSGGLVTASVAIFCFMEKRFHRSIRRRDHLLLLLLSLSTLLLAIANLRYLDLPAVGLLVSSFYSPALAVTQVALLTGLAAFAAETITWEYLLAGAVAGLLAAAMAGQLRSRDELALLGGGVGLAQGGVYFLVHLIVSASAGVIWFAVLPGAIFYGLLGMAWSVMALGISPYLERLFDLVTPIRLAELSNPNCPLLKRLATEAPGTFQHTLFVACLAEAAARELHCNVELVRAGTLYHDIGKMHDPLSFIENQMGRVNKHDAINDPWISAEIIKKHVSEGLVMARKYGLPCVIRDFIPEHQGTLLISYFYYQAKQQGKPPIAEADFHYDGPIPQSRETGIVMLADGCEAALRSLKDTTPETALAMIVKIFKARWREQQLQDSSLKYEELPIIAEVFVRVWQQFHHQRIVYPKAALEK